jgi:hypothetical protein
LPKGDSAKGLTTKGTDAEARQNYEKAFDYFKQAYRPEAERPEISHRLRAHPVPMRRRRTCIAGRFCAMRASSTRPLASSRRDWMIDPSSFIAQQELKRTSR